MKCFPVFLFLTVFTCLIFGDVAVEKEPLTNDLPFPHYETGQVHTCGGVLTETSDQILYKPFIEVGANERCVFIVAAPRAAAYNVKVLHFGHEASEGLINIAGVSVSSSNLIETIPTQTNDIRVTGDALVITFHSNENGTTGGFALEYSVATNSSYISENSEFSLVGGDTIFAKYPSQREQYDNNELGIFALPPVDNVYIEGRSRQAIYKRIQLEGCYDNVSIYEFNAATNRYNLRGSICDDIDTELISLDDVGLIVFRTDSSVLGRGFTLAFSRCGRSA